MTTEDPTKPIKYTYGYRHIVPLGDLKEEVWKYSIQLHKNQNGKHFDLRMHRPGEDKAYSWAMKKVPFTGLKPVLAMRTHDHNLEHMTFEGPLATAKGYGDVKLIGGGDTTVTAIDEKGITFKIDGSAFRLRPYRGKRYLFEPILY